ncbi:MAG: hypothetical protein R2784_05090 [Saprospiraceae bacterium]
MGNLLILEEIFAIFSLFNYLAEELKKYLNSGKAGCVGQLINLSLKVKRMVFEEELKKEGPGHGEKEN